MYRCHPWMIGLKYPEPYEDDIIMGFKAMFRLCGATFPSLNCVFIITPALRPHSKAQQSLPEKQKKRLRFFNDDLFLRGMPRLKPEFVLSAEHKRTSQCGTLYPRLSGRDFQPHNDGDGDAFCHIVWDKLSSFRLPGCAASSSCSPPRAQSPLS